MKKILLVLFLTVCGVVHAHPIHHHQGHWHRSGDKWVWVMPTIIGGVIGYEIAKSQQPVIVQQPVVVTPPILQQCSPWTETQNPDGTITRTRTCTQ